MWCLCWTGGGISRDSVQRDVFLLLPWRGWDITEVSATIGQSHPGLSDSSLGDLGYLRALLKFSILLIVSMSGGLGLT